MRKKALCYLAVTLNAITMKKALFISLCALLLAGTGCKKKAEPEPHKVIVTSVSVKPSSLSLKVGETAQLTATVTPVNADNDNVNWSSSDNSVATVADAPDGTSGWFLPSMFQWQQAIHAMTGKTTEISLYEANSDYTNDKFSAKIADSEAHLGKFCYASSSEFDATYNWHFDFNEGIARRNAKWCDYTVRAFLAF